MSQKVKNNQRPELLEFGWSKAVEIREHRNSSKVDEYITCKKNLVQQTDYVERLEVE